MTIPLKAGRDQLRYWAAVFALLAPCCWFGLTSFSWPVVDDPTATATAFLDDLTAGRFEAAYARTTQEFQYHHTLEEFREMLRQCPSLQETGAAAALGNRVITLRPCNGDPGAWRCQIHGKAGKVTVGLKILAEQGEWKVSSCILLNASSGRFDV